MDTRGRRLALRQARTGEAAARGDLQRLTAEVHGRELGLRELFGV